MLRLLQTLVTLTLILIIASISCSVPLLPTATPPLTNTAVIPPTPIPQPTTTPQATATRVVPSTKLLIRVTTTSDWTVLRLVSGGTWVNPTIVSSSPEAAAANIDGNLINLSQTLAQAQTGQEIEISAEVFFDDLDPSDQLIFEIQRGHIGFTQVEISVYIAGQPVLPKTFIWEGINEANGNRLEVRVSIAELLTPPTPRPTPRTPAIDATTLQSKVIFGYQGWFGCPTDGSPVSEWVHWFRGNVPSASNLTVDLWPDISELGPDELCATNLTLPDGSPLMAYSAYNETTVMRHFQWMEDYGIDGVASQRFVGGLEDPRFFAFRNQVAQNVQAGAETYGRVFYIEYDISGVQADSVLTKIKNDWEYLIDTLALTDSPQYLHERGLPVVEVWGLGVDGSSQVSAAQAQAVIDYFHTQADPKYRAVVIGGVGSFWRTGTRDAKAGADWAAVYRSLDVINPWAVGRYGYNTEADTYRTEVTQPDLRETQQLGIGYMPVIFPGFSWKNLFPQSRSNEIPRQCGKFYWHQAYNAIDAGAPMVFVAMFDEVDEGTAMFKLAPTADQLPNGANLVPLNVDGCDLPSDWYLRLGGETGKMLRGEIALTSSIPIQP